MSLLSAYRQQYMCTVALSCASVCKRTHIVYELVTDIAACISTVTACDMAIPTTKV